MKNFKHLKVLKISIAIIFLFILIFNTQQWFTKFPSIKIYVTDKQINLAGSKSLRDIFGSISPIFYFTNISNILVISLLVLSWIFNIKVNKYYKLATYTYMTITLIVFWTVLAWMLPWGQSSFLDFEMIWEHMIVFMVMCLFHYLDEKEFYESKTKSFLFVMVFPVIYLIFGIMVFEIGGVKIYPFFNIKDPFVWDIPFGWNLIVGILTIISIAFVFVFVSWLFIKSNNNFSKNKK